MQELDARNYGYKDLNRTIKTIFSQGENDIHLRNVTGQRYIANGVQGKQKISIEGIPGNDTAAYMDGLEITVKGNAQDALANTMNSGRVIVHGNAGDTVGYSMRGGEIFIKGNVGYRVGIHMKEYCDKRPVMVVGGKTGSFLGEYMAGGIIIILGLGVSDNEDIIGSYSATGMHGGVIYIRGEVNPFLIWEDAIQSNTDQCDMEIISNYTMQFSEYFGVNYSEIMSKNFIKIVPGDRRPYGNLYAY